MRGGSMGTEYGRRMEHRVREVDFVRGDQLDDLVIYYGTETEAIAWDFNHELPTAMAVGQGAGAPAPPGWRG
jgi:hypothetical protein